MIQPPETRQTPSNEELLERVARLERLLARKRHLDGVRILADLLRAPYEIAHPALLTPSG